MKIHYFTLKGQARQIMLHFLRNENLKAEELKLEKKIFERFAKTGYSRKAMINLYFTFAHSLALKYFRDYCYYENIEIRKITATKEYKATQKMLGLFFVATTEALIFHFHKDIKNNLKF